MATKKTSSNFLTDGLKKELKTIIGGILDKDKKLTMSDVESITITKTDNGFLLVQNNGTPNELPTTEVLQVQDVDNQNEEQEFRDVTTELMYRLAEWSGVEFDEARSDNLVVTWNGGGEYDDSEGDKKFDGEGASEDYIPPTKQQILAAAMGTGDEKGGNEEEDDFIEGDDYEDDGVVDESELGDNEWVAGDNYDYDGDDDNSPQDETEWDDSDDDDYVDANE